MASTTAAAIAVPSFCGLRAETAAAASSSSRVSMAPVRPVVAARASSGEESFLLKAGKMAMAGAAVTLVMAGTAVAGPVVKMGADSGDLKFVPSQVEISSGDSVTFLNNRGFPHNVVFDEDECPSGVNVDALSHEDYLNAPNETFDVSFTTPGEYSFYCEPHQGAGMVGKIVVK